MPKKMIDFDMRKLTEFLREPRSIEEIRKKFSLSSATIVYNILDKATYQVYIYETDKIPGDVVRYGIMG